MQLVKLQKQYEDIVSKAKLKADEIIQSAVEEGNIEAKPVLEKGAEERGKYS